jgi:hypothetical protein
MKIPAITWTFAAAASLALIPGPNAEAQQLIVDDDKVQCPTAQFTKIQDAVNAASPGAQIRVCPGIYREQVSISKPLNIVGDNGAIVVPSSLLTNSTNLVTGNPVAAIILVSAAEAVNLTNLTVNGTNNGISGCLPQLIGIYYRNASGTIDSVVVKNTRLGTGLEGCQSGLGIFAQSSRGKSSLLNVVGSSVHHYQKNGITANESGTQLTATDNTVIGIGPTSGAAQNGIQIGFGASGDVENNVLADHVWSPCASPQACEANATNILVFQAEGVVLQANTGGAAQVSIAIFGNNNQANQNTLFDSRVFHGIDVVGNANQIQGNSITRSDEAGIFIDGNDNQVTNNRINEAPIGILKSSTSSGNILLSNLFFNTSIPVKDPPVDPQKLSPYR